MKVKRFVLCLFMLTLIGGICFISCGNTSKAKAESDVATETAEETFQSFLKKFTSSASFQYTRVKFPLKTPITLMTDDGNSEKTFPFTQEKWPLLDAASRSVCKISYFVLSGSRRRCSLTLSLPDAKWSPCRAVSSLQSRSER